MWSHATLTVYKSVIMAPAEPLNCAMLGGRGWVRTNDFCRVKGARVPHTPLQHPASHHNVPAQQPWRLKAMWCCTQCHEASSLANLWQSRIDRGPHGLGHTFATWPEDAGTPSRGIDELMGQAGGRRGGDGGSRMGRVCRRRLRAGWLGSPQH